MPALVIESFPEALHAKLRQIAASHHRTVTQETIHLLETAIAAEEKASPVDSSTVVWQKRPLLPEYETLIQSGIIASGTDSTRMISEDRDGE
jgi:plasmid stability protein